MRRQLLAGCMTVHSKYRPSGIQKGGVPVPQLVTGVADVATHLELDVGINRPEVAVLKDVRSVHTGGILRRSDLDEVDPVDLGVGAGGRARYLATDHEQHCPQQAYELSCHSVQGTRGSLPA